MNNIPDIAINNANIVNNNKIIFGSVLINQGKIIDIIINPSNPIKGKIRTIDAQKNYLIPGVIDDQVHFREPGLTHKADIYSESKAAIAGGITSFMEMPNTNPQTTSIKELDNKNKLASTKSFCNYSFYIGATNDNISELNSVDTSYCCGIKVFMGSSTGNMLVNDPNILSEIFKIKNIIIATHCEDDNIINHNINSFRNKFGEHIPIKFHEKIRSREACFSSSSFAVKLAKKHDTRLHVLHVSTKDEIELFEKANSSKRITAEVCVHHLFFDSSDYDRLGTKIKWNPSIKDIKDKNALLDAINNDIIDIIATDHAPHTLKEKQNSYFKAPSGGPLVQHSLPLMLELYHKNKISIEKIVSKMCHAPAELFSIDKRGYIKKGYWADLVIINTNNPWTVSNDNLLYKCKWSPVEGYKLNSLITHTIVNGNIVYENGNFSEKWKGKQLKFNR